ncbi:PBSX family phage terminase large subunit [Globicatella sanguinis]|uniref:PBSX family phage terminase large subunit n=1 Tax=Globicatella sanguinis TaxID=13076 RepID=UPI0008242CC0
MTDNEYRFKVRLEVNPSFYDVWATRKPFNILKGGRGSFKSSVISMLLVRMMLYYISKGEKANVVCIRKTANNIRDSVYAQIIWALNKFGVAHDFKLTVSPFTIKHKGTGSTFYFYGHDDFNKLKSNIVDDVIALWYEESADFKNSEEFDQTNATFLRQRKKTRRNVTVFWSYNPPRNPYHWINEWVDGLRGSEDYLIHESTYLDDELGFVNEQMLNEINRIKRNDYDYYRYLYLGEAVGLGDNVYNMDLIHEIEELPDNEYLIGLYFSTDTGHQVSATTSTCYGLSTSGNVFLLDTSYYSPVGKVKKRTPVEHCQAIRGFEDEMIAKYQKPVMNKTIDSAEGAIRNQYYDMYGEHLHPVAKKKKVDMVDYVQDLLAQGRFFVLKTEGNKIFISEHQQYRWDSKSIETNPDNPSVVKVDDHTCDSFQYFVLDNLSHLGLAVGKGVR